MLIKKEEKFRERLQLSFFLENCFEYVRKWPREYANNDNLFIISPTIELKLWTGGYHWAKSDEVVNAKKIGNITEYYCPIIKDINAKDEDVKQVKNLIWNTFNQFKKRAPSIWILTLPNDECMSEKWKEGECMCPHFLKK